jgi:hypothetical protein
VGVDVEVAEVSQHPGTRSLQAGELH